MQTARDFLSILERDYHLDFSGSRGSSVETLLRQFVAAHRVEARDQGQALMATANANLLHELQAKEALYLQETAKTREVNSASVVALRADHLKVATEAAATISALKAEIAAIHSVADVPPVSSMPDDFLPEAPKEEN